MELTPWQVHLLGLLADALTERPARYLDEADDPADYDANDHDDLAEQQAELRRHLLDLSTGAGL